MSSGTLFLSENALPSIHKAHAKFFENKITPDENDILGIRKALCGESWGDFDTIYLALYSINLIRKLYRSEPRKLRGTLLGWEADARDLDSNNQDQLVRVDFMLDIEVSGVKNNLSLIDEHAVASLINFRNVFDSYINWDSKVFYVDLGCVLFSFLLRIPNVQRLREIESIPDINDVGKTVVERQLSSGYWDRVCKQYHVREQYVGRVQPL